MTPTPSTRNITKVFRSADAYQIDSAAQWYSDAYEIAAAFAAKHDMTVEATAAVIAVLSPMQAWGNNVNLAARILVGAGTVTTGGLSANVAKANRIILGESPSTVVGGQKVTNFYRSILTKGAEGLTVDRHAFDIAVGVRHGDKNRPGISKGMYATIEDMYRRAARILSKEYGRVLTPGAVQSVTWMVHREKYWARGAWDTHEAI
jgi:hypothetical protein